MNAHDLTFGIEFETTMPAAEADTLCPSYGRPPQVAWLPYGWKAKTDVSIRATGSRRGIEFVSPVLKGSEGLAQVMQVIDLINAHGGRVNASTGLHIHVGGFDMNNTKILKRVTTLVANFEQAIYASTGTDSRENGRWCQSHQAHNSHEQAIQAATYDRYRLLNLSNLNRADKRTVEFRAFAGSLNKVKVAGYVRMCLGLVEQAIKAKRITKWVAKPTIGTSPIARKAGAGSTALTRLFYQLGWTKGRKPYVFGDVTCTTAPSNEAIKKELMRMARQYDAKKRERGL